MYVTWVLKNLEYVKTRRISSAMYEQGGSRSSLRYDGSHLPCTKRAGLISHVLNRAEYPADPVNHLGSLKKKQNGLYNH